MGVLSVSPQPASSTAHRSTRRGQTVLEVLRDAADHLDACQVYRLARGRHPRLSLSTVYRTLAVLRNEGLVRELHLGHEHYHYEYAAGSGRHDHFHLVCRACGRVVEFVSPLLVELGRELQDAHGFLMYDLEVEITATCGACTEPASGVPSRRHLSLQAGSWRVGDARPGCPRRGSCYRCPVAGGGSRRGIARWRA